MNVDQLKKEIEKRGKIFGQSGNIYLMDQPWHACHPDRPNGWDCRAVKLEGNNLELGKVSWDFELELEEASDYDWSFAQSDFRETEGCYDLSSADDFCLIPRAI